MIKSLVKITLRRLYREKLYAAINISGLSLAFACCLIIGLWLRSELTYDQHNLKYKQIYRLINKGPLGDSRYIPSAVGPLLTKDYPVILRFVRFALIGMKEEPYIRHGDKSFQWENIWYADNSVFDIFTHDIIYGDTKTALVDSSSVAVSRTFSRKYFGDADPVGETINFNNKTYNIKLVFDDLPDNTSLKYDILVSYSEKDFSDAKANIKPLQSSDCITYLLMPENYDAQEFKHIYNNFSSRYKEQSRMLNSNEFWLQPLSNIHFISNILGEDASNKFYIYGFALVAFFILGVACINYINLATAKASTRQKEVGMRKVIGADKTSLIFYFLGESIVFIIIATILGTALAEMGLKLTSINGLLNKTLVLNPIRDPDLLAWFLVISLFLGITSGGYPAFYLSSMPVLSTLAKRFRAGKGDRRFRQLLVLIQFAITVGIVACTLIMFIQMRYVTRKPLGFEKKNRIIITLYGNDLINKIPYIKKELLKNNSILGVTQSNLKIGKRAGQLKILGKNNEDLEISYLLVDDNFFKVMGMQIVSGRDFSKKLLTDVGTSIVVNEAAARKMGWNEPLGKNIFNFRVVGVVKDFNFRSLHNTIEPLLLIPLSDSNLNKYFRYRQLILHISGDDAYKTLNFLKEKFEEFDPEHPFQYEFVDDYLNQLYYSDQRMMKLVAIFTCICIFITFTGLFGLVAFTTQKRTKEIGIRKVLGASTWQIIRMLFRKIFLIVLSGSVIASLIAYYFMDKWLTSFAYRTNINPLVFLISIIGTAGIAFLTVVLQSYKTAQANPVEALRYE